MDSIYRGDLSSAKGRRNAWIDSLLVDHAVLRLIWTNTATVRLGRLYRANHPTPARLASYVQKYGIRTIVNLRGQNASGSDALSRAAAARLGLVQSDIAFKSSRAPERTLMLALIDALRAGPEPMLVHCKSGADRAGFAAGVYLLLTGGTATEALAQMSWRHGHLRRSRAGILDGVFIAFRDQAEARMDFATWVACEYDPAAIGHPYGVLRAAAAVQDRLLHRE